MIYKFHEIPDRSEKVFEDQPENDEESELHTVWTSQLVRIKEIVDSKYSSNHPLEMTFGQSFSRAH